MTDDGPLPAGGFAAWLAGMQRALRGEGESDVPCDGCTACCTSSQFVHIEPDETATLRRIPAELLFPAPRLPIGHVLMGYDERGHCPMLIDGACSIYEDRPRTCRTYDCRIFAATGIELEEGEKPAIAERSRRWVFDFSTDLDRAAHDAVLAAAVEVTATDEPMSATQRAVLAITGAART
jgi:Fe-S-cluster containining protein